MDKLNERLWSVVKEYTTQMAELFDCSEWHWIGTEDDGERPADVCDFGDTLFFTLEDMQIIIDRLDEWVKRYGSREAVAQEARDWFDWWLGDHSIVPHPLEEITWSRLGRYMKLRPAINLENWLAGCPRQLREPTLDDELRLLACQRDTVRELAEKYGEAMALMRVLKALDTEIAVKNASKEKRDEKTYQNMKKMQAYRDFEKAIKDEAEAHPRPTEAVR